MSARDHHPELCPIAMAALSDEDFLNLWLEIVGEPPAIMLDRADMIAILEASLRRQSVPAVDTGYRRPFTRAA